jgi:hypothetical protein
LATSTCGSFAFGPITAMLPRFFGKGSNEPWFFSSTSDSRAAMRASSACAGLSFTS